MLLLLAVSPELLTTQEEATTSFFIEAIKKKSPGFILTAHVA